MTGSGGEMALTAGGWVFLILAWGGILALTLFSFYRLIKTQDRKK